MVRSGHRVAASSLVLHAHRSETGEPPRIGFVVSKAVGNSVQRHRVTRQLRHVAAAHVAQLEPGTGLVVRALPPAAGQSSTGLAEDFERALTRINRLFAEKGGSRS